MAEHLKEKKKDVRTWKKELTMLRHTLLYILWTASVDLEKKNIYICVEVSEILINVSIIKKWHCIKG